MGLKMKKNADSALMIAPEYRRFIEDLKARVVSTRISAARSVNRELILLYWDIGFGIVQKQTQHGWGDSVVEMVAADLRAAFPDASGFSARNVWDMRRLYLSYTDRGFLSQAVREIDRIETGLFCDSLSQNRSPLLSINRIAGILQYRIPKWRVSDVCDNLSLKSHGAKICRF